ncbi:hypothetical protein M9Y10_027245 [Tritrichomonas musculus]|uniref:Peptidase S8/S53 domain-containing protein n=1 Tax=Tritrichomonas musculus TaxID=1915356 RepID=A0ABR2H609_9EUKA
MLLFIVLALVNKNTNQQKTFTFRNSFKKELTLIDPDKYVGKNANMITSFIKKLFGLNKSLDGMQKEWYYVHVLDNNKTDIFKTLSIKENNQIIKNTFTAFLSKEELDIISNVSLVKKIEPNEKIIEESQSIDDTNNFIIITSPHFELSANQHYIIEKRNNDDSFTIRILTKNTSKKKQILKQLSKIPEIKSIIAHKKPNFKNTYSTGFTQRNSFNFSLQNGFYALNRYLNDKGINGEGQVITILDSPLDFHHSMFRDENVKVELNKYMPNHRKIVYYSFEGDMDDWVEIIGSGEHGTHTSGTLAGKNICPKSGLDFSHFDGNAPEAKILFVGPQDDDKDFFDSLEVAKLMKNYNSYISSNSWGSTDYDTYLNYNWGMLAQKNPQSIFVYAAGNEYEVLNGNFSICDPGGSKNVLAVGALESFYDESPAIIMISLDYDEIQINLIQILDEVSLVFYTGTIGTDPSESNIIFVDMSKGNQCELITGDVISVIYGKNEEYWISDCELTQKERIFYCQEESESIEQLLKLGGRYCIQKIYQMPDEIKIDHASFSSTGPANKGILKPDVVAPGTRIISADSNENSDHPHGCLENLTGDYRFMDGTSMATPNVAGGMALIYQYFNSGKWMEKVTLDGSTARALVINSCTHPKGSKVPDIFFGHGVVDLSTILPIEKDFGVQITRQDSNKHSVPNNGHVTAKLKVNPKQNKKKLQITLSYIDPLLSIESPIPITRDLDMIVTSPSNKIYIGDHLPSKDTQHTSTNEKIIIDEDEIESGEYTIHVYGGYFADNFNNENQRQDFAVAASGPIENGYLEFYDSYNCPCKECDQDHPGFCLCDKNKNIGQVCQVDIEVINNVYGNFSVGPLEVKRVRFVGDRKIQSIVSKSNNPGRSSTIWVSKNCHLSLGEYEMNAETGNETEKDKLINIDFESKEICIAIFNFNDVEAIYNIEITLGPEEKKPKESNENVLLLIICVVAAAVLLIIIIIYIIVCVKFKVCKCCRKDDKFDRSLMNSELTSKQSLF